MHEFASLEPVNWEAQVHRETYIAVLKGQLQRPGSKRALATRVNISPVYLSYLLDPYNHRTAAADKAKAIVEALELAPEERRHLFEHMMLAREHQTRLSTELRRRYSCDDVNALVAHVAQLNSQVTYARDSVSGRATGRLLGLAASAFMMEVDPWRYPVEFAEVALAQHQISNIRNQGSRALFFAKRARNILASAHPASYQHHMERYEAAYAFALRSEAVGLYTMQLPRLAIPVMEQVLESPTVRTSREMWLPQINRDHLGALLVLRRYSLREAERLVQEGSEAAGRRGDELAPLLVMGLEEGLARAYMQHDHLAEAEQFLEALVERMDTVPVIGQLHRAVILSDFANLLWRRGDRARWRPVVSQALTLCVEGGLFRLLHRMHQTYRHALDDSAMLLDEHIVQALRWEPTTGLD